MPTEEYPVDIVDRWPRDVELENPTCHVRGCGARAFVWAEIAYTDQSGELKVGGLGWCGHHATESWDAITAHALHVTDHRDQILPQVTP